MKPLVAILMTCLLLPVTTMQAQGEPDPLPPGVRVLFSPQDDLESAVVALIEGANSQILFNQRAITNPRILHALTDAFVRRKVYVAGIIERNPPVRNYVTPGYLASNGIPVFYAAAPRGGENAICYLVIDRQTVALGSYEWTFTSQEKNNENLLLIAEPTIAQRHIQHFHDALLHAAEVTANNPSSTP